MNLDQITKKAIVEDAGCWFESGNAKIWPKDRSKGLVVPHQNYLQVMIQKVVNKFEELELPARIIGLKPRQKGSTTYFAAVDYHWMRRKPAYACLIGGQYSQTDELWSMIKTYHENDKFDWSNTGSVTESDGNWTNGSKMKAETANDKLAGIAGTYQILHATEIGRWTEFGMANASEVLINILKCVPLVPDSLVVLESTAEGETGEFPTRYKAAIPAEDFLSGRVIPVAGQYVAVFAPWFAFEDSALRLTDDQKRDIEYSLDEDPMYKGEKDLIADYGHRGPDGVLRLGESVRDFDVWEQLAWRRLEIREECKRDPDIFDRDFPHCSDVAFQKSGKPRFNRTGLKELRKTLHKRARLPGILDVANGTLIFRQTDENEAKIVIWEKPITGCAYLLTCDPMTGESQVAGQDPDYHSATILRKGYYDGTGKWNKPCQAARVVLSRWEIDVLESAMWDLARFYGPESGCAIVIEMNMDRGLTELLKQRGANLYRRQIFNRTEYKTTEAYGYMTDPRSRERCIEWLATQIREFDKAGYGIEIHDEYTLKQFENFIINKKGKSVAGPKFHDDDVTGIAMGGFLLDSATVYAPPRWGSSLPPDLANIFAQQNQQGGMPGAFS